MLINSANLMGGSTEPDNHCGFGLVHLDAGMPINGEGNLALFVADAATNSITEFTQVSYTVQVEADATLDLRATLCWIDSPASKFGLVPYKFRRRILVDRKRSHAVVSRSIWRIWGG